VPYEANSHSSREMLSIPGAFRAEISRPTAVDAYTTSFAVLTHKQKRSRVRLIHRMKGIALYSELCLGPFAQEISTPREPGNTELEVRHHLFRG